MEDHVPVSEALKLVTPFKGDKREVLAFVANEDTSFDVTDPSNADTLYKFVLTRMRGEPRIAIIHRDMENWEQLKVFLRNTYRKEDARLSLHSTI
jgi:hypothetical protein